MYFEVVGEIASTETIAEGHGIRELARLVRSHGTGNWRKRKGIAKYGCRAAMFIKPKYTGTKRTVSASAK